MSYLGAVSSQFLNPEWVLSYSLLQMQIWYTLPQIHLWCYTWQPHDNQHRIRSLPHMHPLQSTQPRKQDHFSFCTFWTKFCNILKYGMNLKFEAIVQIFRKIIQLNLVIRLKSTNEYYQKIISKSGRKMDLYPAMLSTIFLNVTMWNYLF